MSEPAPNPSSDSAAATTAETAAELVALLAANPVNLADFEALALARLAPPVRAYIAGAAADEISLRRNRSAFDEILLKPRVLRDVSHIDTAAEVCGQSLRVPILLAPTAYHRMAHPEGERATARGAGASGATMVVSALATTRFEEIAEAAAGPLWFQLYVQRDRAFTRDLVQRVEAAGCKAICITVDTPVLGTRNRETREGFALAPDLDRANLRGHAGATAGHFDESGVYSTLLDPTLTWKEIDWICGFAKVPILLKGIMAPEDAALALDHDVAGLIVSNHGARNLDTTPAAIEALPGVAAAAGGKLPILFDGGIRRGTDVVKALALGARAVLVGRPCLYALAAAGAAGVERVLQILSTELVTAMALCGCTSIAEIDRTVLWPRQALRWESS
jgi:4-hydroxymandelate oxidase